MPTGPLLVAVEAAGNPVLTAYRHVLANADARVERSVLEREVRESLREHRKEFLARYSDLEDAEAERKRASERVMEDDPGEAAARALAQSFVAERAVFDGDRAGFMLLLRA